MPTLSLFYGIVIRMYWSEQKHDMPHFHAEYSGRKASIAIHSLAVLDGKIHPKAMALVIEWAKLHQKELLEAWAACSQKRPPKRIAPLE